MLHPTAKLQHRTSRSNATRRVLSRTHAPRELAYSRTVARRGSPCGRFPTTTCLLFLGSWMNHANTDGGELHGHAPAGRSGLIKLAIGAVGIVYGDLGTSPLYAVKECFNPVHGVTPAAENIMGVVSLIFWTLTLVVVVKYLTVVMRADNRGEGGILALMALLGTKKSKRSPRYTASLMVLGLLGAALLVADGMITPAISVISAVEGLQVATPVFSRAVMPVSAIILIALFLFQSRGTAGIGAFFGPVMIVWFICIAALGVPWIIRRPDILWALNPWHAIQFMMEHRLHGIVVLGAVVLCITGTEALYADLGHFGRRPIRFAWYALVFPALLLNYFGQGAILLASGEQVRHNPFYAMAPQHLLYPVVFIATAATVIASQALISGTFSLAQQAVQLGYSPRLTIVHTSREIRGQIYVPEANWALMLACVGLVVTFQTSSNLASAYGIAVTGTMVTTSILLFAVARQRWRWSLWAALALAGSFLLIDLLFLAGNLVKIIHGGWFPLAVSAVLLVLMTTYQRGRDVLADLLAKRSLSLDAFMNLVAREKTLYRAPGVAVFLMGEPHMVPPAMLHHLKLTKTLHQRVILLHVTTENVPEVPADDRMEISDLGSGFWRVIAHYGFIQDKSVPEIVRHCQKAGIIERGEGDISYFLGRLTLRTDGHSGMSRFRKALFGFLLRNERPVTQFFDISPNRVAEIGIQVSI